MLEGITLKDLFVDALVWSTEVAMPIAGLLGLLPFSRTRSILIWVWAFLPVMAYILLSFRIGNVGLAVFFFIFFGIYFILWAVLSALAYKAVLWLRDFSGGEPYGADR
jgi:hypothetical protein